MVHNAAFDAAQMDAVYVRLEVPPSRDDFKGFMDALLEREWLDCRGLSVTIPHKENALAYVGAEHCDELSARIGAINTITISDGQLRGDNTDYASAIDSLCTKCSSSAGTWRCARPPSSGQAGRPGPSSPRFAITAPT